jgi:2Fe-2S ferredoxin
MPTLTILPTGKTVEVAQGTSLLEAILQTDAKFPHKCGAEAKCGSCHIFVHDGRKTISKMQRIENERLDSLVGVSSKSRLACQAMIGAENVTVELLGFGSGL